jgi:hypothetical protein
MEFFVAAICKHKKNINNLSNISVDQEGILNVALEITSSCL